MSDTLPPTSRAERAAALRAQRLQRLRTIATVAGAAVAIVLFAAVATDTLGVRGKRPSFADEGAGVGGPPPAAIDLTSEQLADREILPPTRPISHEDPLRVWMGGDSHVGVVGRSLGELLGSTGVVALTNDYRISSGLLGGPRDWVEYAPGALAAADPEVAIFMIGTNDAVVWSSDDAGYYRERATTMMDLLSNGGQRLVLWVGTPTLGMGDANDDAAEINTIVRSLADERPEVIYVDAFDLFDDGAGGFTPDLQSLDGEIRRMRVGDGVHFTEAGAQLLASVLYAALDEVWSIEDQAVPGSPIGFTTAAGSGCGGPCDEYDDDGSGTPTSVAVDVTVDVTTDTTASPPTSVAPTSVDPTTVAPTTTLAPTSTAVTEPTVASTTPSPPTVLTPSTPETAPTGESAGAP